MEKDILLSIIIPIYNLEKYISKCLNSIVKQSSDEIEILLINDGSIDNSEVMCKEYEKKYTNIKYFYQKNSGVSVARNKGLELSNGKYIYFVDGDDWIIDNSLNKILETIKNNEPDMILSTFIKTRKNDVNVSKKIINKRKKLILNINQYNEIEKKEYVFTNGLFNPSLCCNIFNKKIFLDNNIRLNENVKYTEDMDCCFKLFLKCNIIDLLDAPIYVYRQSRKGSATNIVNNKRIIDTLNFSINMSVNYDEIMKTSKIKNYINQFSNYQYSIVLAMLFAADKNVFISSYEIVKKYQNKLQNILGIKGKIIRILYKLLGFNITGKLLSLWFKFKM